LHAALMPPTGAAADALPIVTRLLNAGADPNATCPREPDAYTPLLRAAALKPAANGLAEVLRAAGADPAVAPPNASA